MLTRGQTGRGSASRTRGRRAIYFASPLNARSRIGPEIGMFLVRLGVSLPFRIQRVSQQRQWATDFRVCHIDRGDFHLIFSLFHYLYM